VDNQAGRSVFRNPHQLTDKRKLKKPIRIGGVDGSSKGIRIDTDGNFEDLKRVGITYQCARRSPAHGVQGSQGLHWQGHHLRRHYYRLKRRRTGTHHQGDLRRRHTHRMRGGDDSSHVSCIYSLRRARCPEGDPQGVEVFPLPRGQAPLPDQTCATRVSDGGGLPVHAPARVPAAYGVHQDSGKSHTGCKLVVGEAGLGSRRSSPSPVPNVRAPPYTSDTGLWRKDTRWAPSLSIKLHGGHQAGQSCIGALETYRDSTLLAQGEGRGRRSRNRASRDGADVRECPYQARARSAVRD
jgi:hypothetical protein